MPDSAAAVQEPTFSELYERLDGMSGSIDGCSRRLDYLLSVVQSVAKDQIEIRTTLARLVERLDVHELRDRLAHLTPLPADGDSGGNDDGSAAGSP